MTYDEAKYYLSSATFIYQNVTIEEVNSCPDDKWFTVVGGVNYLGTSSLQPLLSSKQIIKQEEN